MTDKPAILANYRRATPEEKRAILDYYRQRYEDGASLDAIGREVGKTTGAVRQTLLRAGIQLDSKRRASGPRVDVAGQRFGRLVPVDAVGTNAGRQTLWRCICDCGSEAVLPVSQITSGTTRSCGCLGREAREANHWPRKHGAARAGDRDPMYLLWCGVKTRCFNQGRETWRRYGGRGITMHPEWRDSFVKFRDDLLAEIGPRPAGVTDAGWPLYTLDRIDNDGNYEPGNIRWATALEQSHNSSRTKRSRQDTAS